MRALCERVVALVAAIGVLFIAALPANAQSFEDALARFTADSFNDTDAAIGAVAASGHAMAQPIIQALQDGRLLFDPSAKKVYIRNQAGQFLDAASGQVAPDAAAGSLKPVRLNNRLRRAVEAALGGLTLLAPDPHKRFEAAQAVFKSRDANALSALDTAIGRESDPRLKRALSEATRTRAACWPGSPTISPPPCSAPQPTRSPRSTAGSPCGTPRRTRGTASRSARCCCSPPSGSPSRSASWA
jgi:hypothetical protein